MFLPCASCKSLVHKSLCSKSVCGCMDSGKDEDTKRHLQGFFWFVCWSFGMNNLLERHHPQVSALTWPPTSRLLALSLLTCDSAMSALSSASSSSCWTLRHLDSCVLACSSCMGRRQRLRSCGTSLGLCGVWGNQENVSLVFTESSEGR